MTLDPKDYAGYDKLQMFNELAIAKGEIESLMIERSKLSECLRQKDAAMSILIERAQKAGVDLSDLIP